MSSDKTLDLSLPQTENSPANGTESAKIKSTTSSSKEYPASSTVEILFSKAQTLQTNDGQDEKSVSDLIQMTETLGIGDSSHSAVSAQASDAPHKNSNAAIQPDSNGEINLGTPKVTTTPATPQKLGGRKPRTPKASPASKAANCSKAELPERPPPDFTTWTKLPNIRPNASVKKLRIANWNCGGGDGMFVKMVFAVLMRILKMDIIFVQEVKTLNFTQLSGHEEYDVITLGPITEGYTKRGLFLMYRKEIAPSLFNGKTLRGGECSHSSRKKKIPSGNIEVCSVDVLMENGITRRLINLYHAPTPASYKDCVNELEAVLEPLVNNNEALLIGDGNLNKFSETMKRLSMTNHIPEEWKTNYHKRDWSQPDILYSSVKNSENLLLHKLMDPKEMLKKFSFKNLISTAENIANLKQIQMEIPFTIEDPGNYHRIFIAEIGDKANPEEEFICSSLKNSSCTSEKCMFFTESVNNYA